MRGVVTQSYHYEILSCPSCYSVFYLDNVFPDKRAFHVRLRGSSFSLALDHHCQRGSKPHMILSNVERRIGLLANRSRHAYITGSKNSKHLQIYNMHSG